MGLGTPQQGGRGRVCEFRHASRRQERSSVGVQAHRARTRTGYTGGREPHGNALPAPCEGTSRGKSGGKREHHSKSAGNAREHSNTQRARSTNRKGHRTNTTEHTYHMEGRTSERGQGKPGQNNPPHTLWEPRGAQEDKGGGIPQNGTGPTPD